MARPHSGTAGPLGAGTLAPLPLPSILCCEADVLLTSRWVVAHPYSVPHHASLSSVPSWGLSGLLWHGIDETWAGGRRGPAQKDQDVWETAGAEKAFSRSAAVPGLFLFPDTLLAAPWLPPTTWG